MAITKSNPRQGFILVEIVVVSAFVITAVLLLLGLMNLALKKSLDKQQEFNAYFLAQQNVEALRSFRGSTVWAVNGLGSFFNNTPYHTQFQTAWMVVPGISQGQPFTEQIIFYEVRRDANKYIVEIGGVLDPDSKKAEVLISWQEGNKKYEIKVPAIFTNWM